MVTPAGTSGPVPTTRSLLSSCAGGEQVSGIVMVGLLPAAPVTVMSSTVHAASAVALAGPAAAAGPLPTVGALGVAPVDVPSTEEEQETTPAASAAAITILPTVRMGAS